MAAIDVTFKPATSQKRTFTAVSAQSTALDSWTNVVRVYATQDCYLAFGESPTAVATGTDVFLPAGQAEYFRVDGGCKIAVIRDSADGNLFITEMTR